MTTRAIRIATPGDAADISGIYAPNVSGTVISFEVTPPDVEEMRGRIAKILPVLPWLAWDEGAAVLGYAYASAHNERAAYQWSVNVSAYVHASARRRGIASALYRRVFEILALQGYQNAYAGITLPNPASVRLHESVGFTPVGVYRHVGFKMGAWHDVGWWERRLGPELMTDPKPPRPFAQLVETGEIDAALKRPA